MTTPASTETAIGSWSVEPVGDRCLLVRLSDHVGLATSQAVHAVTEALRQLGSPVILDVVPAFTTVAVHFDVSVLDRRAGSAYRYVKRLVEDVLHSGITTRTELGRIVEIPACYGGEYGPDLEAVAKHCNVTPDDVVARHCAQLQTLYTFFFSPGNPFSGPVDPALNIPRRSSPRTRVPAGSVAIANGLSCIYQTASPGGWHLIARTPLNLFNLANDPPLRLQLGDRLKFVPISPTEFDALLEPRT